MLMMFEDAHWTIQPRANSWIYRRPGAPAAGARGRSLSARNSSRPGPGRRRSRCLLLNRLGEREGEALVRKLAGNARAPSDIVAEIVERTDGVPLFVEELTKAVLETAAQGDRGAAVLATTARAAQPVPVTLHASLMARLDRLGPAPRRSRRSARCSAASLPMS